MSTTLSSIDLGISADLEHDLVFRERYLRRWAANEVSAELRSMRLRRRLKQAVLAEKAGTGQSAISRIEKQNYDGWTFKTLLTIAMALDARLTIKLEPIEDVIRRMRSHENNDHAATTITDDTTELAQVEKEAPESVPHELLFDDGTAEEAATRVM